MHHLYHHANCADGFAAACIAYRALLSRGIPADQITVTEVNYGDQRVIPEVGDYFVDDHLIYLDFTPPKDQLDTLVNDVSNFDGTVKLTIIDHHEKAAPLHGYTFNDGTRLWEQTQPPTFESVFNLSKSGAGLTWSYFYPDAAQPYGITLIEHRDLGHAFQQPDHPHTSDALNLHAFLFRYTPRTFDAWEHVIYGNADRLQVHECHFGARLRASDGWIIDAAVDRCHWLDFSQSPGLQVSLCPPLIVPLPALSRIPAVNGLDAGMISDACQALLRAHPSAPFSASWFVNHRTGQIVYSLRSREPGHPDGHVNVSTIAAACSQGGGGHPCAAGFQTLTPIPFAS